VSVLKITDGHYIFLFNIHHIICDVWSLEILMRDLFCLYDALLQDTASKLPTLGLQYKDFSAWQNQLVASDAIQPHRDYWHKHLALPRERFDLPTDAIRPAIQSFRGHTLHVEIDEQQTQNLMQLCKDTGASLFMALLAVVNVLLYRHTGTTDITVGSPIAGRTHSDLDDQVGFYVNTLALRTPLKGDDNFLALLETVKRITLAAYQHQVYPFDRIVEELELTRDMSHAALFDVMVILQNVELAHDTPMHNIVFTPYGKVRDWSVSRFDQVFHFRNCDGRLILELNYNCDLFQQERMERCASHLQKIIDAVCASPEQPIQQIDLLSTNEKALLLTGLKGKERPYPYHESLVDLFQVQAEKNPEALAVVFNGNQLTYQQLNQRAGQLAQQLRTQHVIQQNDIVVVAVERSPYLIISLLAVLKAGGCFCAIDPTYPENRIRYMLEDSRCRLVLTDNVSINQIQSYATTANIKNIATMLENASPVAAETLLPVIARHPLDTVFIVYTSGSTGNPKGVMLNQRGFINMIYDTVETLGLNATDKFLQFASASFDAFLYETFSALLSGAALVLVTKAIIEDTQCFQQYLVDQQVTTALLPPVYLRALNQAVLPSIRHLVTAGEAAKADDVLFYAQSRNYYNAYGPTETSICAAICHVSPTRPLSSAQKTVPIGLPVANTSLYVLDENAQLVPLGVVGEICVAGVGVSNGYLNQPALTAQVFVANPFVTGGQMYRTGDWGRWLPDGQLELIGRKDNQTKISGHRIEPNEIAQSLLDHPAIEDAMVIVHLDEKTSDKKLVAYYTLTQSPKNQEAILTKQHMRAFLAERLPAYMVPGHYIALDKIPLTANGKIDRAALPNLDSLTLGSVATEKTGLQSLAPSAAQALLLEVWQNVLHAKNIGLDDNYFSLGGDSIKAIQISARLRELGYQISVNHIFLHPTVAEAALELKPLERQVNQDSVTGEIPLTPIQHWFFSKASPVRHHFNQAVVLHADKPLQVEALRQALLALQTHHDALRIAYPRDNGTFRQFNLPCTDKVDFELIDLSRDSNPLPTLQAMINQLHESFDLINGFLVKAALFRTEKADYLYIGIHHLVVDTVSWRILLDDLSTAYGQASVNATVCLPLKTDSFKQYADCLSGIASQLALTDELAYWQETIKVANGLDKPLYKKAAPSNTVADTAYLEFQLSEAATAQLLTQAHHAYNTNTEDLLLVALAVALHHWQGSRKNLVILERHGREEGLLGSLNVNRTVGWFTTIVPFLLQLPDENSAYQIRSIKENLRSIPNKGMGYGLLRYLSAEQIQHGLALSQEALVGFNYLGEFKSNPENQHFNMALDFVGKTVSPKFPRFNEINMIALIKDNKLEVGISYNQGGYEASLMETLLAYYQEAVLDIIAYCLSLTDSEFTPSDFSYTDINLDELDNIFSD
jgi:amino acid adenylation domain-containing protein/non-ribosomal peptide synthase protein (TIGR01720 family)